MLLLAQIIEIASIKFVVTIILVIFSVVPITKKNKIQEDRKLLPLYSVPLDSIEFKLLVSPLLSM